MVDLLFFLSFLVFIFSCRFCLFGFYFSCFWCCYCYLCFFFLFCSNIRLYLIQIYPIYQLFISPYSVRMRENADQNNSEYGHFLRSECKFSQNLLFMLVTSIPCSEAVARRCSLKKVLLKDFSRITEKRLCQSLFFNKVAGFRSQFWLNISII